MSDQPDGALERRDVYPGPPVDGRAQDSGRPAGTLRRRDVYPEPLVDGRPQDNGATGRLRRQVQRVLVSQAERQEAELERRIRTQPGVTRANTIALISPKGGVGKTTSTFVAGNLLATHLKLRAVAVDANPDFGTLARLAPDDRRSERSLADLLDDADGVNTAAELGTYVSRLPTGLQVLGAPRSAELTASLGPERYGELVAFLASFYEVVLLDLGTGVAGPLARFANERADQVVLVTTPDWVTSTVVLDALSQLGHDRTTVVLNKSSPRSADVRAIEERFRAEHLHRSVTIPYDERLATMLDSGSYSLDALTRPTRLAIKGLGVAVAEQLV
jgi:MinD-like ATPase involved in chromosome partitioning or flagellar assembly